MNKVIISSLVSLSVAGLVVACSGAAPSDLFSDAPPQPLPTFDASPPIDTGKDGSSPMDDGAPPTCAPEKDAQFCGRLAKDCGNVANFDNCGTSRTVNCGDCSGGQNCNNGACTATPCVPDSDAKVCVAKGFTCDKILGYADNCGMLRTIDCGPADCEAKKNTSCKGNKCIVCEPETDAKICFTKGFTCGKVDTADNCGIVRTIDCGDESCPVGDPKQARICQANKCTCVPKTPNMLCGLMGKDCGNILAGTISDGCGSLPAFNCGNCPMGGVCGLDNKCPPILCIAPKHVCDSKCVANDDKACGPTCINCLPDVLNVIPKCVADSCDYSTCKLGTMMCPPQLGCFDFAVSSTNCGACGTKCAVGAACVAGFCK